MGVLSILVLQGAQADVHSGMSTCGLRGRCSSGTECVKIAPGFGSEVIGVNSTHSLSTKTGYNPPPPDSRGPEKGGELMHMSCHSVGGLPGHSDGISWAHSSQSGDSGLQAQKPKM